MIFRILDFFCIIGTEPELGIPHATMQRLISLEDLRAFPRNQWTWLPEFAIDGDARIVLGNMVESGVPPEFNTGFDEFERQDAIDIRVYEIPIADTYAIHVMRHWPVYTNIGVVITSNRDGDTWSFVIKGLLIRYLDASLMHLLQAFADALQTAAYMSTQMFAHDIFITDLILAIDDDVVMRITDTDIQYERQQPIPMGTWLPLPPGVLYFGEEGDLSADDDSSSDDDESSSDEGVPVPPRVRVRPQDIQVLEGDVTETQCPICITEFTDRVWAVPCKHSFCHACIDSWLRQPTNPQRMCPFRCGTITELRVPIEKRKRDDEDEDEDGPKKPREEQSPGGVPFVRMDREAFDKWLDEKPPMSETKALYY